MHTQAAPQDTLRFTDEEIAHMRDIIALDENKLSTLLQARDVFSQMEQRVIDEALRMRNVAHDSLRSTPTDSVGMQAMQPDTVGMQATPTDTAQVVTPDTSRIVPQSRSLGVPNYLSYRASENNLAAGTPESLPAGMGLKQTMPPISPYQPDTSIRQSWFDGKGWGWNQNEYDPSVGIGPNVSSAPVDSGVTGNMPSWAQSDSLESMIRWISAPVDESQIDPSTAQSLQDSLANPPAYNTFYEPSPANRDSIIQFLTAREVMQQPSADTTSAQSPPQIPRDNRVDGGMFEPTNRDSIAAWLGSQLTSEQRVVANEIFKRINSGRFTEEHLRSKLRETDGPDQAGQRAVILYVLNTIGNSGR